MILTYKKQGDGRDSWRKDTDNFTEMVYSLEVENWRLKVVLSERGLLSQVETALNGLQEPNKTKALYAWEYSNTVNTSSQKTKFIQGVLGLTIQEVTEIFQDAINLEI